MLKGRTKIELFDVKSGKRVHVQEKDNMVTNALSNFLSTNPLGTNYRLHSSNSYSDIMFPLYKMGIGGIILFPESISEDATTVFATSSNIPVGYASNDVNTGASTKRGSLNQTESYAIDNGYKFVWDFATSQANGTISALSLTNEYGGINYFGDTLSSSNRLVNIFSSSFWSTSSTSVFLPDVYKATTRYVGITEVNASENYVISIYFLGNVIYIDKLNIPISGIGVNDVIQNGNILRLKETHSIYPSSFISSTSHDFFDGKDGYWYGFMSGGNSSGNASVKWIKISKTDYSFTEGTWTLTNTTLGEIGNVSSINESGAYANNGSTKCVLMNGYLYCIKYDKTGIYKINISTPSDVTLIPFGFTSNFSDMSKNDYYSSMYYGIYLYQISDMIIGSDFIISSDNSVTKTANTTHSLGSSANCAIPIIYGNYLITFSTLYNYQLMYDIFVITPYLVTINNITPVTKTADKTMKITYTVTES